MRLSVIRLAALLVPSCLIAGAAASAQPAPASPRPAQTAPPMAVRSPQMQLRSQMSIMEGVLERAVNIGIRGAMGQMPDLFQGPPMFTGPRARGFKVDGYGVFFDVEVPALPASFWSISVLNRDNEVAVVNELNRMRALLADVADTNKRAELARALDRVQARVSGAALSEPGAPPASRGLPMGVAERQTVTTMSAQPAAPPRDPDEIYTGEVKRALVDAMLQQGVTMEIGADEWFTVAASQPRAGFGDPDTMTMYLSIRGRDLAALAARQITREEAAKRIVIRNF